MRVLATLLCLLGSRVAAQSTAYLPETTLVGALQDPAVSLIVLTQTPYDVGDQFQPFLKSPLKVTRNVTLSGLPGQSPLFDLDFQQDIISLCDSCVITFENMTLSQERHGLGAEFDAIRGGLQAGSKARNTLLRMRNVNRMRVACVPVDATIADLQAVPASKHVPSATAGQLLQVTDAAYAGVDYPQSVRTVKFTADSPLAPSEEGGMFGGYSLDLENVTFLCRQYTTDECLKRRSKDVCVHEILYEMRDDELLQPAAAAGSPSGINPAVIAVPVAVGVLLLTALVAGLLWHRRRKRRREQQQLDKQQADNQPPGGEQRQKSGPPGSTQAAASVCVTSATSDDSAMEAGLLNNSGAASSLGQRSNWQKPRTNWKGWRLYGTSTTPMVGAAAESPIDIGELLGSGSFGRVYKGRWAGMDVAVKIIEHASDTSSLVENEVQLQLFFTNSPYIVRCFHYESYVRPRSTSRVSSARSNHRRAAVQAAVLQRQPSQQSAASGDSAVFQSVGNGNGNGSCSGSAGGSSTGAGVPGSGEGQGSGHVSRSNSLGTPPPHWQPSREPRESSGSGTGSQPSRPLLRPQQEAGAGPGSDQNQPRDQQHPAPPQLQRLPQQACTPPQTLNRLGSGVPGSAGSALRVLAEDSQLSLTESLENLATAGSSIDGSTASGSTNTLGQNSFDMGTCKAETWIVLELCDCGNLYEVAADWAAPQEGDQQMLERLLLLRDAACGLEVLHKAQVVHGDLNARNVLVSSSTTSPLGMVAKLSDLGLSRVIKHQQTHRTTNTVGTMSHMPPELLRSGYMSPAVDIYSFGIMMWELYTGQIAFRKVHYAAFFETVVLRNVRPFIPPGMPDDYRLLMERCWVANPADRPSAGQLVQCLEVLVADRQARIAGTVEPAADAAGSSSPAQSEVQPALGTEDSVAVVSAAAAGPSSRSQPKPPLSAAAGQLLGILGPMPVQQQQRRNSNSQQLPALQPPRQSSCPENEVPPGDGGSDGPSGKLVGLADRPMPATASRSEPLCYVAPPRPPAARVDVAGGAGTSAAAPAMAAAAASSPERSGTLSSSRIPALSVPGHDYDDVSNHMNWFV